MNASNVKRWVLWAALIAAPLVSILIMGLATGTSLLQLDAWSTTLNDEQTYSSVVKQMHAYGTPQGVSGYNEVMAERLSWGTYTPFVFYPMLAGSYITGIDSHNFIYLINIGFGVAAVILVVALLRPTVRESIVCLVLFLFQFIVTRYLASGMSEASYVFFACLLAATAIVCVRWANSQDKPPSGRRRVAFVLVIVLASVSVAFWGIMRPYLLAFVLVPIALLIADDFGLPPWARIVLACFSVACVGVALGGFMYFSNHYIAPYFEGSSIGSSMGSLIASALGNLVGLHVEAVKVTGAALLKLRWVGIMTLWFALEWVVLLVMAVRSVRARDKASASLQIASLLAGFALFEANILLYSPRQLHRSLICCAVYYAILIAFMYRPREHAKRKVAPALVVSIVVAVLCAGSLVVRPSEFALPQADPDFTPQQEDAACAALQGALPQSSDPWDNTIAHPIESSGFRIYFCLPDYCSINCCTNDYLADALDNHTLKSRYVSLPSDSSLVKHAKGYDIAYEGIGHTIYRVR